MDEVALLRRMFDVAVESAAAETAVPPHLPPRRLDVLSSSAPERQPRQWRAPSKHTGRRTGRSAVLSLPVMAMVSDRSPASRWLGQSPRARRRGRGRGSPHSRSRSRPWDRRSGALLDLRRRLFAAISSRSGHRTRRQAGVNRALLHSGASIHEMNCVRKHLSAIKAGRLAVAAAPAKVVSLIISDVPGDEPSVIASGPTVPDATTLADASAVLKRYGIEASPSVRARLADPSAETPKPGDPVFERTATRIVATPLASLEAAALVARNAGIKPLILGDSIEGEAAEVGRVMAGIARHVALHHQPASPPCVLISGGETTVTVRGQGRGGRNVEFLLSLAIELKSLRNTYALAADTDGVDGAEEIAGAIVAPDTLARAVALGINAKATPRRQRRTWVLRSVGRSGDHRPNSDERQ